MSKRKELWAQLWALVYPGMPIIDAFAASERAYQLALEWARERGASECEAQSFASWVTTLFDISEPHPLHPPLKVSGLSKLFSNIAWGEPSWNASVVDVANEITLLRKKIEKFRKLLKAARSADSNSDEMRALEVALANAERDLSRLQNAPYERALHRVLEVIRKKIHC